MTASERATRSVFGMTWWINIKMFIKSHMENENWAIIGVRPVWKAYTVNGTVCSWLMLSVVGVIMIWVMGLHY